MHNAAQQWLAGLLQHQSLPASSVPRAAQSDIANLQAIGFIRWEKSGAGARYLLENAEAAQELLDASGYLEDHAGLTPKASAVARHGDAHRGCDDAMLMLLSTAGQASWHNQETVLDVRKQVDHYGIASFVARPGDAWLTDKPVALVENLDLLIYGKQYFERIGFPGSVLYYSGWLSRVLIEWLTERQRAPAYTIFPDYDLVGIKNYLIAKSQINEPVDVFVPDNLDELLRKYGKREKLESQSDRAMIEGSDDPVARSLYQALLNHGRGLDQESLLIDTE